MGVGGSSPRVGAAHLPDVVYINRPGEDNDELRHSLRSVAANVPHRRVWVAGHTPRWVKNVHSVPLRPLPDKFDNQYQSLAAVLSEPDLADEFYLFNDDMYVVERFDGHLPVFHLGPLREYADWCGGIGKNPLNGWLRGMREMVELLERRGHPDPLCYENHTPVRFTRAGLAAAIRWRTPHFLPFSYYPLLNMAPGEEHVDAKGGRLGDPIDRGMPFLSSEDDSFEHSRIGEHVRGMFQTPCFYEGAPAWTLPDFEEG